MEHDIKLTFIYIFYVVLIIIIELYTLIDALYLRFWSMVDTIAVLGFAEPSRIEVDYG